jgi:glycosyltransferase involved in cell wall biosynthesis
MVCSKKIAIVHYRAGRTDGVSLEMEKRKSILQAANFEVKIISGPLQNGSDFIIDELEFDTPEIREIKENSFKYFSKNTLKPQELMEKIQSVAQRIESAFLKFNEQERFDGLLVHNIFSHGRHIAAASAFTRIARLLKLPIISTNHDYYWEREEYLEPDNHSIRNYLDTYVPPHDKNITHVSINSLAQKRLKSLKGIDSVVIPDVFDFKQPYWQKDAFNYDFSENMGVNENDFIVLQATRIVERKGIELAIRFVKELSKRKKEITGNELYNGKELNNDSRVVFLLAGYAEDSAKPYLNKLKQEITSAGILAKFIDHKIDAQRNNTNHQKTYSLWDAYVFADLITYPSLVEGWGNQFIEAIFAKKPIVLFEYPVFKADIKKEGYHFISLGDEIESRNRSGMVTIANYKLLGAVDATIAMLNSKKTNRLLDENFEIGKKYHEYAVLREFLENKFTENEFSPEFKA